MAEPGSESNHHTAKLPMPKYSRVSKIEVKTLIKQTLDIQVTSSLYTKTLRPNLLEVAVASPAARRRRVV